MKKASLASISYEQGLENLAKRRHAIKEGKCRAMSLTERNSTFMLQPVGEKVAFNLSDIGNTALSGLSGIKDKLSGGFSSLASSNPELTRTLLASGLGAGAGALAGSMAPDEKHKKRNVLMGALAGGALGGGLGLATNTGLIDRYIPKQKNKISDVVSPERMAYLERNRLPSLSNPTSNSIENVSPWLTGLGGIGAASYGQNKAIKAVTAKPFVDSDRLEGSLSGILNNPPKNKAGKPVAFDRKNLTELFKDEAGKIPKGAIPARGNIAQFLAKLSPEKRKELFSRVGLVADNVHGNASLIGRLQRAFGNETASQIIESSTENNPRLMQLLKGKAGTPRRGLAMAALGIPALAQAYLATKLMGTAGKQTYNSLKWNQLNNRIKNLQRQD